MIKFLIFVTCLVSPVVLYTFETVPLTKNATALGHPFWDVETQNLYFADFKTTLLFRYSWSRNTTDMFTVDGIRNASYLVPIEGSLDRYLVTAHGFTYIINWDGRSDRGFIEETLFTIAPGLDVDFLYTTAHGEIFLGTIEPIIRCYDAPNKGFYRYTRENGLEEIAKHYTSTTGIVIIGNILYHLDACQGILSKFDFDPVTRAISNERKLMEFPPNDDGLVIYDGLVADQDGNLYSCHGGTTHLIKIDPTIPAIVEESPTPRHLQLLAFGGPTMETLFVTSANLTVEHIQQAPAGDLLLVSGLSAPGIPVPRAIV